MTTPTAYLRYELEQIASERTMDPQERFMFDDAMAKVRHMPAPIETPAARSTDPETSHKAAEEITASGRRHAQQQRVFLAVKLWPGRTSAEIAALMNEQRQMPARRLSELVTGGYVERGPFRKCTYSGKAAITWTVRLPYTTLGKQPANGEHT